MATLVKIDVYHDGELWCARGIGEDVFTQGHTLDELFQNVREAVELHFDGRVSPRDLTILIVSELKLTDAPAPTS